MLDLNAIREAPRRVKEAMRAKGLDQPELVDRLLELDEERRAAITELQDAQARSNEISSRIGALKREGKDEEAEAVIEETQQLKQRIKALEETAREKRTHTQRLLLKVPNIPHRSVPVGTSPEDNEVEEEVGEKPTFDGFTPRPHWKLTAQHDLVDFERGAKVTGAGFPFYLDKGARLQRALVQFFLDQASSNGYIEMQPPLFINADSAHGTGQLPDKEDLMYEIPRDDLFPIPTAEVPVTNFLRDEILQEETLPQKFCAYTPCFRREAGSHGSDVRGLNRLHQFDKVELVQVVHPDESYRALEALRSDAERLLTLLELPYRRLLMCTGDMGFTQAKKYDLEVWSAGQERWLEVSSISNFEAFQARRMQIRYRATPEDKPALVHTLNGSGLALPRVVAALLENNQQADGTIQLPEVLHPYTGFTTIGSDASR
ncbi:serine--tRNA ligase [Salisaeta longa]|uniref:serine--tRNA ligase n=1 Tax=Salisaeta longa TaxID=503170 RepID=UPI0003B4AC01|nr:serine--tRNA ligase [Salisaeta longa]